MLTISFDRLALSPGTLVLDVGTGFGRHAFELARRGARVVALDQAADELTVTGDTFAAMVEAGEIAADRVAGLVRGDAARLPFTGGCFDVVITSEVLEHLQDDVAAIAEMARVLRAGGQFAATVPSWFPELVNWKLSDAYHAPAVPGGHVRIYAKTELAAKLRAAGMRVDGSHRAHGLHSPYWWLRCAVGPADEHHPLVTRYRRLLEWDIARQPRTTRLAERLLAPVIGKSTVLYATKPPEDAR